MVTSTLLVSAPLSTLQTLGIFRKLEGSRGFFLRACLSTPDLSPHWRRVDTLDRMGTNAVSSVVLLSAMILAPAAQPGHAAEKREPLPADLSFKQLDGQWISMGELRGKAVLFDFWATWCAPCLDALPHLRTINARFEDKPFAMLSISVDESRAVLKRFIAEEKTHWPHIWDGTGQIARTFGVRSFPTYLIVDHTGRVASGLSGWSPRHEMRLSQLVGAEVSKAKRAAKKSSKSVDRHGGSPHD